MNLSPIGYRMNRKRQPASNFKATALWSALLVIFIAELLSYTWCRVQCTRVGYEITRSEAIRQKSIALQNNLKIELAVLKSPERIARIARDKLGLVMPNSKQTIVMP